MLGSRAWRKYIVQATKEIDPSKNWHDILSYFLTQKHPVRTPETITADFIKEMQDKGHIVCGLTSRERNRWYDMPVEGVDELSTRQLNSVNIDFNNQGLENAYPYLAFASQYYKGTFFADIEPKGAFLDMLFKDAPELPPEVVFIDDKESQGDSVSKSLTALGIPHKSYFYTATEAKGKKIDPLIANIQLYYFYSSDGQEFLSDEQAAEIARNNPGKGAIDFLRDALEIASSKM